MVKISPSFLLRVDLTLSKVSVEEIPRQLNREFLGGKGVAVWLLFQELPPGCHPLSAENKVIFSAGLLTGTLAPAAARLSVVGKNLLTGGICTSNCGGHWAPELKFAGFEHVIVEGASAGPVYLLIENGKARLLPADHLWGLTTWQTEAAIQEELGDPRVRVASIGPAGENLVKSAAIIVDGGNAAARGGLGAVLGFKKIKALAVRGTGTIYVDSPEKFYLQAVKQYEHFDTLQSVHRRRDLGTHAAASRTIERGGMPTRNFQDDCWSAEKVKKVEASLLKQRFEVRKTSCFSCPAYCGHFYEVKEGPYRGSLGGAGFHLGLFKDFGSKLDVTDPAAILYCNTLCNQLGMDIDNASGPIGWAFELYEKDIISAGEADGLQLTWGNHEAVVKLIKKMAYRQGMGNLLAEGAWGGSQILGRGSGRYAVHVKGQDLQEGMRVCKGWALGITVAPRGGGHLNGAPQSEFTGFPAELSQRIFGTPCAGDPSSYRDKEILVYYYEQFKAAVDALGICYFLTHWSHPQQMGPGDLAPYIKYLTGEDYSAEHIMHAGRRIHNIEKAFNTLHAGFARRDDYPPERLVSEGVKTGEYAGERLKLEDWEPLLSKYYLLHGWDPDTGLQTREILRHLELEQIAARLFPV